VKVPNVHGDKGVSPRRDELLVMIQTQTTEQHGHTETTAEPARRSVGVTGRAVFLGLLGAAAVSLITPYNNNKIAATPLGGNQFPIAALFMLLLLVVANIPLRRWWRHRAFAPGEILTVWSMVLASAGIPSSGMMRTFIPNIPAPLFFSNASNEWQNKVWGSLPVWLKMTDKSAADAFFIGYPRGQEHIPWSAWIVPLIGWGTFGLFFTGASFCVASLLRKQWVENERFAFPLVTLPLLLAEEPREGHLINDLLRSPVLWLGAVIPTVIHTLKGMHLLYPTIPDLPLGWNLASYFTTSPWNQIGQFSALIFFLVIGFSYLLPREVCFSIWFFFLFYKGEILLGAYNNWDIPAPLGWFSEKQFHTLQAFGGALALLTWTLWSSRNHLRNVWRKALGEADSALIDDSAEMLSYRGMLLGILLCYGGMGLWLSLAHVPTVLIGLSLFLVTLALVVISWLVCQAGMLFMAMPFSNIDIVSSTIGTAQFPIPPLYALYCAETSYIYNTREMLAPSLLNGAKASSSARFDSRRLLGAMAASVAVSILVSVWTSLELPYYNGGGNALKNAWTYSVGPQLPLKVFANAASVPYVGSWVNVLHLSGGFLGVLGLLIARSTVSGLVLHPIGFLGASTYATQQLWFSFFIGWAAKFAIQHYGGMRGYTLALPFFLGLIVGDVMNAMVWVVLGYLTGTGYNIMPG
jgi:hypothetical protein